MVETPVKPVSIDKVSVPPVVATTILVLPPVAGVAVNLFSLYPKVGLHYHQPQLTYL